MTTLAKNPEDALEPDIAYKVISYGMREGFGHGFDSLPDYINATKCDYLGARRIAWFSVRYRRVISYYIWVCAGFSTGYLGLQGFSRHYIVPPRPTGAYGHL